MCRRPTDSSPPCLSPAVAGPRVKGKKFDIPELLGHDDRFKELMDDGEAMLAIARLAPQVSSTRNSPLIIFLIGNCLTGLSPIPLSGFRSDRTYERHCWPALQ